MSTDDNELEAGSEDAGTLEFDNVEEIEADESGTSELEASSDESDEGTSDDTDEDEDLISGRFKRGEEDKLAESYRNLEAAYSRTQNEIHQLKQQMSTPKVDPAKRTEQFAKDLREDPIKAIEALSKNSVSSELRELKTAQFQTAYDSMSANLPDFKALEPTMQNIATQYQDIIVKANLQNDPLVLEMLYGLAKGQNTEGQLSAAEQAGKKKGQKAAAKKRKARLEGASSGQGKKKLNTNQMTSDQIANEISKGNLG